MRVNKSDLDDAVVEDGEAVIILKSDTQNLTTKSEENGGTGSGTTTTTPNGLRLPSVCTMTGNAQPQQNGRGVAMATKQRIPVEDCEDDNYAKEANGHDLDCLTSSLLGCSIQETARLDIEEKLAELTVKDKKEEEEEEEEETRCASLQSQSSIITVDPPSLPHEEEEEKGDAVEDLTPRGPITGKPTSYRPNNEAFNHISNKSYSSHSLDRFHNQATPFSPPLQQQQQQPPLSQAVSGFSQNSFVQNGFSYSQTQPARYSMAPQMNTGVNIKMSGSGKRVMDDDEDNPYKYTRPVEESGYGAPQPSFNDLSRDLKMCSSFSQVSRTLGCGGQVMDSTADLLSSPIVDTIFDSSPQVSLTEEELKGMLEMLDSAEPQQCQQQQQQPQFQPQQQQQQPQFQPQQQQQQPQFQQQQYSPQVTLQQQQLAQQVVTQAGPVPTSFQPGFDCGQVTQMEKAAGRSVRDYDPGYTSENSPPSDAMGSPGSSPKSAFSPMRPPSNMSQDSGIASPYFDDNMSSAVHSPPGDYSHYTSNQFGITDTAQAAVYMSPHSMVSTMSPHSVASSDDLSMASAPSPSSGVVDSTIDDFFAKHREDLKDALDVVAGDIISTNDMNRKKKAVSGASSQKITNVPSPASNIPSMVPQCSASNIPVSVTPQKRPEKLPIAPQRKPGSQQPAPPAIMKGSVPVMVVSTAQPVSAATPVTSSQPVILMPQVSPGQSTPVIVVVSSTNQQSDTSHVAKKNFRKPVPILPRPGPPISTTAPMPTSNLPITKADPLPKLEPIVPSSLPSCPGNGGAAEHNGVRAVHSTQPSPVQSNTGRKPQQSKMLNIARRLVASMTTEDLQFQDAEGDTYLHVSVCKADRNMVQALLERMSRENLQSMINVQNSMRQTPLYLAVSSNTPEMVELLIQSGADVNLFAEHTLADGHSKEVKTALHCAASNGDRYLQTLQALLAARELIIDLVNSDGHTALHCAILEHGKPGNDGGMVNNLPIIQALIRHGADLNAQGKKSGKTALMYTLESRDIVLIENIVALVDPARLRTYLKTQAFDGSTCLRIMENLQRGLDNSSRQRLHACLKISSRRDNSAS